jgi:uncharacterized protein with HEPN domain
MRDDHERLLDILEAIERIDRYAVRGREAFEHDELIQNWITHQLQIIGEAAARITADLRENHPEVPWRQIIGMRNVLTSAISTSTSPSSGRWSSAISVSSDPRSKPSWMNADGSAHHRVGRIPTRDAPAGATRMFARAGYARQADILSRTRLS